MKLRLSPAGRLISLLSVFAVISADMLASAQEAPAPQLSKEQLDSLVAPIALYPDPLLAQVLAASTYPLELVQLQQWLTQNKGLKEKALAEAVKKQDWDPSVQAMAPLPDVVKRMTENIKWTTDLGNTFLAQENDVMDAVQRMRKKAKDKGALKSSDQMKVENKTVDGQSVIVVEQSNPQVVYVPSYNPTVVYGAPVYPYPPVYYPPPSYYAGGMFLSFTAGVAIGAAFSGGWGYNCGWSHSNNVYVNNNNTFVKNSNARGGRTTGARGNQWQHNPRHRGGAPYSNPNVANRYGGTTRGASPAQRQTSARQQNAGAARQQPGANRAGVAGGAGPGTANNQIGNRSVSTQPGGGGGAFGGGSQGFSGGNARASSSRGGASMRGGGGGGSRGGGGGRGGGRR